MVFTKFMLYFDEIFIDFLLCCGRFPHLSIFLRILNWSVKNIKPFSRPTDLYVGGCYRCRPGEWG